MADKLNIKLVIEILGSSAQIVTLHMAWQSRTSVPTEGYVWVLTTTSAKGRIWGDVSWLSLSDSGRENWA